MSAEDTTQEKPDAGEGTERPQPQTPPNDPAKPEPQTPASDPPKESPVTPPSGPHGPPGKPSSPPASPSSPPKEAAQAKDKPEPTPKPKAKPKPKPKAPATAKAKPKPRAKTLAERHSDAADKDRKEAKERKAKAKAERDKGPTARKRADDPDLRLAHEATALATGGSVSKDGALTVGQTKFGAAVNTTQITEMAKRIKGKDVLRQMLGGCPLTKLKAYAKGEIKATDLPEKAKLGLKELNGTFDPKLKMWPRKDAAILVVMLEARRKGAAKPKAKPAPEKVAV